MEAPGPEQISRIGSSRELRSRWPWLWPWPFAGWQVFRLAAGGGCCCSACCCFSCCGSLSGHPWPLGGWVLAAEFVDACREMIDLFF